MGEMLREWLVGGVYSDSYQSLSDGGPECYGQMTNTYRWMCGAVTMAWYSLVFFLLARPYVQPLLSKLPSGVPATACERLASMLLLLCILSQFAFKVLAKRVIFMLSPCHMVCLMQLVVSVLPTSRFSYQVFLVMSACMYGPVLALWAPDPGLLSFPGEEFCFWYEHILVATVAPLLIILGGRYRHLLHLGYPGVLYVTSTQGYLGFILYNRVFLTPISLLTWANLDYVLCAPESELYTDFPAWPYLGTYYLLFADNILLPVALVVGGIQQALNWVFYMRNKHGLT